MDDYTTMNLELWNELTSIHTESEFYDVERFRNGRNTLKSIEMEELGDVAGKTLLHLQCHFGLDTLSWARLGAEVTGVDFSDKAVGYARDLAAGTGIKAEFILSDIYGLADRLDREYDIVFTSYGVLTWLSDLDRWGKIVARFLRPGGTFYIVEGHPFLHVLDDGPKAGGLKIIRSYFRGPEPVIWEGVTDYADPEARVKSMSCEWTYRMSDVINALVRAGLRIEYLHEFPALFYRWPPFIEPDGNGWWHAPGDLLPATFSLMAKKPE